MNMEQEPGLYEHETIWLGKAMADNSGVAHDMQAALAEILVKLDKNDTNIKGQLRELVALASYIEASCRRLEEYYPIIAGETPEPRAVVKPQKGGWKELFTNR